MNKGDAHYFLEERRKLYEQGQKGELLYCVVWCIQKGVPVPAWLEQEFTLAYLAVRGFEKSWNDVFGNPLPKSKTGKGRVQRARVRRDIEIAHEICTRVQELHNKKKPNKAGKLKKTAIDKLLFAEVGKSFDPKIGGTRVYEIYSRFKDLDK